MGELTMLLMAVGFALTAFNGTLDRLGRGPTPSRRLPSPSELLEGEKVAGGDAGPPPVRAVHLSHGGCPV